MMLKTMKMTLKSNPYAWIWLTNNIYLNFSSEKVDEGHVVQHTSLLADQLPI